MPTQTFTSRAATAIPNYQPAAQPVEEAAEKNEEKKETLSEEEAGKLYEERMEEEYAKREGGA